MIDINVKRTWLIIKETIKGTLIVGLPFGIFVFLIVFGGTYFFVDGMHNLRDAAATGAVIGGIVFCSVSFLTFQVVINKHEPRGINVFPRK